MGSLSDWVGALAPLGVALGGAAIGGALNAPNGSQKAATAAQTQAIQNQSAIALQAAGQGQGYNNMALPAYSNALDFWQAILRGDRTSLNSFLGPEINQYRQGQQNALQNVSQFAPRGGARTTALAELPFQQAKTVGDMYASARPVAAGQVGAIASDLGAKGMAGLGAGISGEGSAAGAYLNAAQLANKQQQQQVATANQIGAGLYQWAKGIDWSTWPPSP